MALNSTSLLHRNPSVLPPSAFLVSHLSNTLTNSWDGIPLSLCCENFKHGKCFDRSCGKEGSGSGRSEQPRGRLLAGVGRAQALQSFHSRVGTLLLRSSLPLFHSTPGAPCGVVEETQVPHLTLGSSLLLPFVPLLARERVGLRPDLAFGEWKAASSAPWLVAACALRVPVHSGHFTGAARPRLVCRIPRNCCCCCFLSLSFNVLLEN